jgi:hypothetical protein
VVQRNTKDYEWEEKMSKAKEKEDWMQKKWRPMMAMMYMVVCIFDFIIFPIMFTVVQFWEVESVNDAFRQWQPLTLIGAGLFHMAMGAILGITAWSRGQEKIAGVAATQSAPAAPAALPAPSMSMSSAPQSYTPSMMPSSAPAPYVAPQSDYKGRKLVPDTEFPER